MWRMVDRIRIGDHGYALVVAPDGQLIAHGDPEREAARRARRQPRRPAARAPASTASATPVRSRSSTPNDAACRCSASPRRSSRSAGRSSSSSRAARPTPSPLSCSASSMLHHRPRAARHDRRRLLLRPLVHPADLRAHARHPRGRRGQLDERVTSRRGDEFKQLGDAFNTMADKLVELQEDVKKQERQAMFGRMAAGLVHDLSHPVQNIGNSCKLIVRGLRRPRVPPDVHAHDRARARHAQARPGRPAQRRPAEAGRALPARRQPLGRRHRRVDARLRRGIGHRARAEVRRRAGHHRRRRVRARPRVPQPDHQRHPGDAGRRPRHHRDGARSATRWR